MTTSMRMDLLAAGDDDVVGAAGDVQEPVGVEAAEVPGAEPLAGVAESTAIMHVARAAARAADGDLPDALRTRGTGR